MTALAEKQNAALIEAQDVAVRFGGHTVLDSVSLQVEPGEIVTLIGLNGSGKTTLVRVMLGLLRPDSGQVVRRKGLVIGYVPQRLHVDGTLPLTVDRFLRLGTEAARADIAAALEEVGVGKVAGQQIARLSGGEFHRVMLARSLLRNPQLLVLDEPMSGVDVAGQTELYSLIARIRDDRGCGILLVSHDLHIVMAATDRVVCLNHHICCTGRPDSVTRNPAFRALFGEQVAQSVALYHHHHDHVHAADGDVVPLQHEHDNAGH